MPNKKVVRELSSQVLQRRMLKIKLEEMSKEDLVTYADFLLETYNKLFNEVRVAFLRDKMQVPENDPIVTMFFEDVVE